MRHHSLDFDTIQNYQQPGAEEALDADEPQTLERGIQQNLAHLSPTVEVASNEDDPDRFVEYFCNQKM